MSPTSSEPPEPFEWRSRMVGFFHDQLPHWVVEHGRYAVTLRCAGSLPRAVRNRLTELADTLAEVDPRSVEADNYRRRIFATLEAYQDQGHGFAPFNDPTLARAFADWLADYREDGLFVTDCVVMPNHLHLITAPVKVETVAAFRGIWSRFKGRSARHLNALLGRRGAFWQTHWYDRWIRDAAELRSWRRYLARNPERAGLCTPDGTYPFLKIAEVTT